jgi:7-carboxy-7-deazaguanine synthase
MKTDRLSVAELFYSVQGEGRTVGIPSVFLRLAGCNLMCGGWGTEKDGELHDGATWRCDTIEVWMKGKSKTFDEIMELMPDLLPRLDRGAHLVITGGEPLLQQEAIECFIEELEKRLIIEPFIEIETNGTIMPSSYMLQRIDQWNCSPKLGNSGMMAEFRLKKEVLNAIAKQSKKVGCNAIFKFVISNHWNWLEAKLIIEWTDIARSQVYLMPAVDAVTDYPKMCNLVIEICKKEVVNFSPREHIAVWNKKTGV